MIGETLIGAAAAGVLLPIPVPAGTLEVGLRVESAPALVELLTAAGRLIASARTAGPADDGEFPGSGYTLMTTHDGTEAILQLRVSADATVYGAMQ